jgi:surface protein
MFPKLFCNGAAVCEQLMSVEQWGDVRWTPLLNGMFNGAKNLVINATDVPNFSGVTNMTSMFQNAVVLTGNFSGWDVSGVTSMASMFNGAIGFNLPLESWDVSSVMNMSSMFQNATSFNQDLSSWNTAKVTNMAGMFSGATNFDQDLSSWVITGVTAVANFTNMLNGTQLSVPHYNALLVSWYGQSPAANVVTFTLPSQYGGCEADAQAAILAHTKLTQPTADGGKNWGISDGGLLRCAETTQRPFITTRQLSAGTLPSLTLPTAGGGYGAVVDWGDGTTGNYANVPTVTHTYLASYSGQQVQVKVYGTFPRLYCYTNTVCKQLVSVDKWGDIAWSSMANAFQGASGLLIAATDTPDLTNVTNMSSMFQATVNLTGNFSGWDTSKITDMRSMFYGATNFDQNLSSWVITKVTAANFTNMLNGTQLSLYNYNALLDSWSKQSPVAAGVTNFSLPTVQYGGCVENAQAGIEGHMKLVQPVVDGGLAWTVTDGGLAICGDGGTFESLPFITTRQLPSSKKLTLQMTGAGYDFENDL